MYKRQIVLIPQIRAVARSVVGRYTPEQLYSSKRDAIQTEIFVETQKIVDDQYIQLNEILVRDVTLPPSIKEAIERKLKQEQESLEYEFRLVTAAKEAEKQRIEARGKADANRILFKNHKVTNLEMETAIIYGLSDFLGHNAISLNAILANRVNNLYSKKPNEIIESLIRYALKKI